MGFIGFNFNLLDQLTFYGFYHTKHGNQVIHFFFVPAILWSVCVWLAYAGPIAGVDLPSQLHNLPEALAGSAVFNPAAVLVVLLTAYFSILEIFAGLTWGSFVAVPIWLTATYFAQHVAHAWVFALGVHIAGWLMQVVVGHLIIEGRRPALLDSLFQSLVLASLFAWMEGLFALDYRPKLHAELEKRIAERERHGDAFEPLLTSPASSAQ